MLRISSQTVENYSRGSSITPNYARLTSQSLVPEENYEDHENCKICFSEKSEIIFEPCGHFMSCASCAKEIFNKNGKKCPMCRKEIKYIRKFYLKEINCACGTSKVNSVLRDCNHAYMCMTCSQNAKDQGETCKYCDLKITRIQPLCVS